MKNAPVEILTRLTLGIVFTQAGWGKFQDLPKVISYFESLNIPFAHIQAPFVGGLELIAGIFILIGLFTRLASLSLIPIMTVAIITAQSEVLTDLSSLLSLPDFLYILLLGWLATIGSKVLSADQIITNYQSRLVRSSK